MASDRNPVIACQWIGYWKYEGARCGYTGSLKANHPTPRKPGEPIKPFGGFPKFHLTEES